MNVLVLNCGSSSIKAAVVDPATGARKVDVVVSRLGGDASVSIDGGPDAPCPGGSHEEALAHRMGFVGLRLGPRVLRTETAGAAALAVLQALWGDI